MKGSDDDMIKLQHPDVVDQAIERNELVLGFLLQHEVSELF